MFLLRPFTRFFRLYSRLLASSRPLKALVLIMVGMAAGWWIYVPIHEFLHAVGCWLAGGEIHRLEIQGLYGGSLLSKIFSFVSPVSEYAGRLSGFDTRGSDWTYALTVYFPYVLSFIGLTCLEASARRGYRFLFGLCIPFSFSPIIGLTGDFYELGSLLLYQGWPGPFGSHRELITDDLFRLLQQIPTGGSTLSLSTTTYLVASLFSGAALAWGTLLLSEALALLFHPSHDFLLDRSH